MAVTIKKKNKKKLSLKGDDAAAPTVATATPPAEAADDEAAVVAAVMSEGAPQRKPSFMIDFICSLLAFLILGALVAVQYLEDEFYQGAILSPKTTLSQ